MPVIIDELQKVGKCTACLLYGLTVVVVIGDDGGGGGGDADGVVMTRRQGLFWFVSSVIITRCDSTGNNVCFLFFFSCILFNLLGNIFFNFPA